jgi:hypothetical protein
MATIIEFDQRYFRESAAVAAVPDMGVSGFSPVPHGTAEWRLRLRTDRPVPVLKELKRRYPLRTYRVLEEDDERR